MDFFESKLVEIKKNNSNTFTYYFEVPQGLQWLEGAHTHLGLEGFRTENEPNRDLVHHMSISTHINENIIGITTRIKGDLSPFKSKLSKMKLGEKVNFFKTSSRLMLRRENKPIYLLSNGVGIAALRPLIIEYNYNKSNIPSITCINVDSTKEYIFKSEFEQYEINSIYLNNRIEYYLLLRTLLPDAYYYIVGSDEFIKDSVSIFNEFINKENIILDKNTII